MYLSICLGYLSIHQLRKQSQQLILLQIVSLLNVWWSDGMRFFYQHVPVFFEFMTRKIIAPLWLRQKDDGLLSEEAWQVVLILRPWEEGILVYVLPPIYVCIELPRVGLARSLSVHVSGALVLWEYTQQQVFYRAI